MEAAVVGRFFIPDFAAPPVGLGCQTRPMRGRVVAKEVIAR
jgi:hypothetical protein